MKTMGICMESLVSDFDPMGKWLEHQDFVEPHWYGDIQSYEWAAEILDRPGTVEDWGCGTTYARRFFSVAKYIGVDGSKSKWCDVLDDLRTRDSRPSGILLRHVLDHNPEWEKLLDNALRCFQERMVIVTFIKFEEKTRLVEDPSNGIPCIVFSKADLLNRMRKYAVSSWKLDNSEETLFFVTK